MKVINSDHFFKATAILISSCAKVLNPSHQAPLHQTTQFPKTASSLPRLHPCRLSTTLTQTIGEFH